MQFGLLSWDKGVNDGLAVGGASKIHNILGRSLAAGIYVLGGDKCMVVAMRGWCCWWCGY